MPDAPKAMKLPDGAARIVALTDHARTLVVEAGAGSGKTALMAGRVALLMAAGVHPRGIAAITFTEAAASELLERIERIVRALLDGPLPVELQDALPGGLGPEQRKALEAGAQALDEINCTTIHGFCQQLVKPYPVEAHIDPGATVIDPDAAEIAYKDLMEAWLSARFGRDRGTDGLGRIPPIQNSGGEDDFFAELLVKAPDKTLDLIDKTAKFLKYHRTAHATNPPVDTAGFIELTNAISSFATWYNTCGVVELATAEVIEDFTEVAEIARRATTGPLSGRDIANLLFHTRPQACKKDEIVFRPWGKKGKWKDAAKAVGRSTAQGEQLRAFSDHIVLYPALMK